MMKCMQLKQSMQEEKRRVKVLLNMNVQYLSRIYGPCQFDIYYSQRQDQSDRGSIVICCCIVATAEVIF